MNDSVLRVLPPNTYQLFRSDCSKVTQLQVCDSLPPQRSTVAVRQDVASRCCSSITMHDNSHDMKHSSSLVERRVRKFKYTKVSETAFVSIIRVIMARSYFDIR